MENGTCGIQPRNSCSFAGAQVTIRPVAGTRKRGKTPDEDAANAADLMADVKERVEHLMLLDLGRNDVGRVSKSGSVRVKSNYEVEYYSHVMHIASQVEGEIREGLDAIDALIAGFRSWNSIGCSQNSGNGTY